MVNTRKGVKSAAGTSDDTEAAPLNPTVIALGQPASPSDPLNSSIETVVRRERDEMDAQASLLSTRSHTTAVSERRRRRDNEDATSHTSALSRSTTATERGRRRRAAELAAAEKIAEMNKRKIEAEMAKRLIDLEEDMVKKRLQNELEEIEEEEADENENIDIRDSRTQRWVHDTSTYVPPPPPVLPPPPPARSAGGGGRDAAAREPTRPAPHPQNGTGEAGTADAHTSDMRLLANEIRALATGKGNRCCTTKLPIFCGNSGEWLQFKSAYDEDASRFDTTENLARLRRSLQGDAKLAVSHQLLAGGDPDRVIALLQKKFGRDQDVIESQMRRIRTLPVLSDLPRQINDFACTVEDVVATLKILKKERHLHSIDTVRVLKSKMQILMKEYADFAYPRRDEDLPELVIICEFLQLESDKIAFTWTPDVSPGAARPTPASKQNAARPQDAAGVRKMAPHAVHATAAGGANGQTECPLCSATEHNLSGCGKFKALSVDDRSQKAAELRVCFRCLKIGHRVRVCKAKSTCGINGCTRRHHKLVHREYVKQESTAREDAAAIESAACTHPTSSRAMLMIMPVKVYGPRGCQDVYALLDPGASTSLIKKEVADAIGAVGTKEELNLAETTTTAVHMSQRLNLEISGPTGRVFPLWDTYTVGATALLSQTTSDYSHLPHLQDVPVEPLRDVTPSLLIGQNNHHLIATLEERSVGEGWEEPSAVRNRLGWVICGPTGLRGEAAEQTTHYVNHVSIDTQLHNIVKEHFKIEALGVSTVQRENKDDRAALDTLRATCRRVDNGTRWEAGLLWKADARAMPENKGAAIKRLKALERKMDANQEFGSAYETQIQRLLDAGYARPAQPTKDKRKWFLPHFAVTNPNKPGKLRVVFDAAARSDGRCLNDALNQGPDLLQSLIGILYRFREGRIAVTADVKEMFLRIQIKENDRVAQRFLWRGWNRESPPTEYEMCSMIFGAVSSPTTAIYVKNLNSEQYAHDSPAAANAIKRQFYMDDYLQSFSSKAEAIEVASKVKEINQHGGFELRGWASNSNDVVRSLDPEHVATESFNLDLQSALEKTLGLRWHPETDSLGFNLSLARVPAIIASGKQRPTKRQMLSLVMSIFDPLGLLAPVITRAKIILQHVWRSGIAWDDELADAEAEKWHEWLEKLKESWKCRVQRHYFDKMIPTDVELHTFCDSSEEAYAAVAYFKYTATDGTIRTALVGAKTRVAPLKPTSIPRLELQAALLGARLADTISSEHDLHITQKVYWTDSRTVLAWIKSDARSYKTFVAHRLGEIDELTDSTQWRWVPTAENVADDGTRTPSKFDESHRWFSGPAFLRKPADEWPLQPDGSLTTQEEIKPKQESVNVVGVEEQEKAAHLPDVTRFSRWTRLVRATAYVLLFTEKCRRRHRGTLEQRHLVEAERLLLTESQHEAFGPELKALKSKKTSLPTGSRLQHLSPIVGEDGLLRLHGRASATPGLERLTAEPVILCGQHPTTRLLVHHHHVATHHANPETVINLLRERYWVLHLRPTVRAVQTRCQACRVRRAKPLAPPMGDLPEIRLGHKHRPFTYCGLDFFGPLQVKVGRRREKRYGALFTCLVTRAVHVEVAWTLSTDSAISVLRRMMARRGAPAVICSDNGTNFRGAAVELERAWAEVNLDLVRDYALNRGAEWRFIPPAAPFMGGAWERLVGSIKRALATTLHERAPTDEVLATLLAEAEHTVNARPLTHVSVDPDDPEALTPNHFLLGGPSGMPTPGKFNDADLLRRHQWRAAQRLADVFWTRWLKEYLPTLLPRPRIGDDRPELRLGDLVIIVDATLPRDVWPRGIVEKVMPGRDGHVRVVDVRTTSGVLRRPARKLIRLPVARDVDAATGGRMSPTDRHSDKTK